MRIAIHKERHVGGRAAWLRAAVLGADDALVSTTSLMIGMAASAAPNSTVFLAGAAGVVAGALSMAAGEYVSVSSQRDVEEAEIALERNELAAQPLSELNELIAIYEHRGLDPDLARQVALQLSERDQLGAHLRDELGISPETRARPFQAAVASAASFAVFGTLPIASLSVAPFDLRIPVMATASLVSLGLLGALGAHIGGAAMTRAAFRVAVGGALAMAITALVGRLFGIALS
jgi:VIT1/CCC1 family predicted Fe2+/Mn2+ transporter